MARLKVFLVERTDKEDWDEVKKLVILAKDSEQALALVVEEYTDLKPWKEHRDGFGPKFPENVKITQVDLIGEPRIVCVDMLEA